MEYVISLLLITALIAATLVFRTIRQQNARRRAAAGCDSELSLAIDRHDMELLGSLFVSHISRTYGEAPAKAEIRANVMALIGAVQAGSDRSNTRIFSLISQISAMGRMRYEQKAAPSDIPMLSLYLRMIGDYYAHCFGPAFTPAWTIAASKPENFFRNSPMLELWKIAAAFDVLLKPRRTPLSSRSVAR